MEELFPLVIFVIYIVSVVVNAVMKKRTVKPMSSPKPTRRPIPFPSELPDEAMEKGRQYDAHPDESRREPTDEQRPASPAAKTPADVSSTFEVNDTFVDDFQDDWKSATDGESVPSVSRSAGRNAGWKRLSRRALKDAVVHTELLSGPRVLQRRPIPGFHRFR